MRVKQVEVLRSAAFAHAPKKSNKGRKADVDDEIALVVKNPLVGAPKRGDLVGVHVYKFKSQHQEVLLAYEFYPKPRYLLLLGANENFYRDLRR